MIAFLLFLNFIIPIIYSIHSCVNNGCIKVNHILTFSAGFIFYWNIPFLFYHLNISYTDNYYTEIMKMFNTSGRLMQTGYLICCLLIYCSFILGNSLDIFKKQIFSKKIKFTIRVEGFLYFFVLLILLLCIVLNRAILFTGYSNLVDRQYAGMFSALVMILCDAMLLHILYNIESNKIKHILKSAWCILFFITSLLILTSGGRLYVVSSLIALICLYSINYKPISILRLLQMLMIGVISMGTIGVLRAGAVDNTSKILSKIIFNIAAEPIFTAYTLAQYLNNNTLYLFKIPVSLCSSFLNLIPSIIFPNKSDYIITYSDLGYDISAPLGAQSSFVSLNIEFGVIGTIIFIFLLSNYLKRLSKKRDKVHAVIYAMLSGQLMFTFFRDPFSVSLIKNMLEFSIILPLVIDIFYKNKNKKIRASTKYNKKSVGELVKNGY